MIKKEEAIAVKPSDTEAQKGFEQVSRILGRKEGSLERFTRAVVREDLKDDDFAFATVSALSESPTTPSADEVRLYYRSNGRLFKWVGTEVT